MDQLSELVFILLNQNSTLNLAVDALDLQV